VKITISDQIIARTAPEGSAVAFTASFYTDAGVATTPTSVRYRVDDPETGKQLLDWQTATPATAITATLPAASNLACLESEKRELLVEADHGLSTQTVKSRRFFVSRNAVAA
jgi:hypothetical protein